MANPLHACLLLALLFLALAFFHPGGVAWALSSSGGHGAAAIPGPPGVLLAFAGPNPHRTLARLAASRGATRLMAFSVGLTRFVVASHPDTAREILAGAAFADRPVKEAAAELMFRRAIGFAPNGEYWRRLRRLASAHAFGPRRRRLLQLASLDNVMASVFGVGLGELGEGAVSELEEMVKQGYELLGTFNWGDHVPLLRLLDVHGVRRRSRALASRVRVFVSKIIEEHKRRRDAKYGGGGGDDDGDGDFVDVLLGLEGEERLEEEDMVAVLWEMIFRGTDTVAILLEWVLARMALHPDIQSKAQAEIDAAAAAANGDAAGLPYLHCVVKECLRMHPPGPLLSWARLATRDAHLDHLDGGRAMVVPAGTTAVVNMWAIARDGGLWRDPGVFRPERFLDEAADVGVGAGCDLRLAPFGAGRRACPGRALAMATIHLWLAQLLRSFRWVPSGDGGVDMSERLNMSLEMEKPLICLALPRT
uniref:Ig-like domain-containing protein n=1 Tax=Oryza punctata TaxID=4537 RepID=A0A0E0KG65_ORYPU